MDFLDYTLYFQITQTPLYNFLIHNNGEYHIIAVSVLHIVSKLKKRPLEELHYKSQNIAILRCYTSESLFLLLHKCTRNCYWTSDHNIRLHSVPMSIPNHIYQEICKKIKSNY